MNDNKGKKLFPIIVVGGVVLSMIVIFLGAETDNQVIALVGVGLFFLTVAAGIFIGNGSQKGNGAGKMSSESRANARKYEPLLLDERTKQHPEVQRLLQYTSVQRVFFDPEYLKTVAAQTDPNVIELLGVFDNMISNGGINGDYPQYPNQGGLNGTSAYADSLMKKEIEQREKEKNKPRRIAGTVLTIAGLALFIIPFFTVFFSSMNGTNITSSMKMTSILFKTAPIGMILIIVGSIIKK